MINVTQPYLPAYEEYEHYLKGIWERKWLTNNGPLVQELEVKLKEYLGVKHLLYMNNGTIALQIAIKALGVKGEIITTPFSYVATTNSILWEGCTPVFADIKEHDLNIDPEKITPLINKNTVAILATHVYGNPCDVEAIGKIAQAHNLKVIYDGAHAFGAELNGKQVLSFGDIATCSFHATKIFHTIEGGCVITNDDALAEKMTLYRQFGHAGDNHFSIGINGKSSEFHAAMGLCLLPMMEQFVEKRKQLTALYDQSLQELPLQRPEPLTGTVCNYSYYPVITDSETRLLAIRAVLEKNNIFTRRYFYPSLNNLPQYKGEPCPVSESASLRALALPIYYTLQEKELVQICDLIKTCF
ncbi:MAG TPA: DegT/DnrJ/EryC1/StrS family aminotransferase [Chitinophagaceae bacterium]|jgi:dTDP-4-amino-4,6-dideoxygalactose transaminase|nr:DegT/DnrJ/EryC1/StrS family aminotransferase [Chitinophagaceae bacterium]